jgi:type III secretory pathway component EscR
MAPVATRMYHEAYVPYKAQEIGGDVALQTAWGDLRTFLLANTRQGELELFADLAKFEPADGGTDVKAEELPFQVVVPAFVLSELKTAFQMGFLLFLPFPWSTSSSRRPILVACSACARDDLTRSDPLILVDGWHRASARRPS